MGRGFVQLYHRSTGMSAVHPRTRDIRVAQLGGVARAGVRGVHGVHGVHGGAWGAGAGQGRSVLGAHKGTYDTTWNTIFPVIIVPRLPHVCNSIGRVVLLHVLTSLEVCHQDEAHVCGPVMGKRLLNRACLLLLILFVFSLPLLVLVVTEFALVPIQTPAEPEYCELFLFTKCKALCNPRPVSRIEAASFAAPTVVKS